MEASETQKIIALAKTSDPSNHALVEMMQKYIELDLDEIANARILRNVKFTFKDWNDKVKTKKVVLCGSNETQIFYLIRKNSRKYLSIAKRDIVKFYGYIFPKPKDSLYTRAMKHSEAVIDAYKTNSTKEIYFKVKSFKEFEWVMALVNKFFRTVDKDHKGDYTQWVGGVKGTKIAGYEADNKFFSVKCNNTKRARYILK